MFQIQFPRYSQAAVLPALALLGTALHASAALALYDNFSYGPTSNSPLWIEKRGNVGSVDFDGVAYLREQGGESLGLAAIQASNLTQTFVNAGDKFRLTFDMTLLDFGGGEGSHGFGLVNGNQVMDLWAGMQLSQGKIYLRTQQSSTVVSSTGWHFDWTVTVLNPATRSYATSMSVYAINPSWAATPEAYLTGTKPYITMTGARSTSSNTLPVAAFCGAPQLTANSERQDRGSIALDNVYAQSAPEPTTAMLGLVGALALVGRRCRKG